MKEPELSMQDLLELVEMVENLSDSDESYDTEKLEKGRNFAELLAKEFSGDFSVFEEPSEEELYEEIVRNIFLLLDNLGVAEFKKFGFADYEYYREVIIDDKKYNIDDEFCHQNPEADEAVCAIDCMIADLEDDEKTILRNVEKMINSRNT